MNVRISLLALALGVAGCSSIRTHRIETEPSGAELYVNDTPIGNAPMDYGFDFEDESAKYTVVAKQEGYVDNFAKVSTILLDGLEERPILIKIDEDESYTNTIPSEAANEWFQIETDPQLDQSQAWQILVDAVTKYYSELGNLEQEAGYTGSLVNQLPAPAVNLGQAATGTGLQLQYVNLAIPALSAIMMTAALTFPRGMVGITDASATRRPSTPRTFSSPSTTASSSTPILHVPAGWWAVAGVARM